MASTTTKLNSRKRRFGTRCIGVLDSNAARADAQPGSGWNLCCRSGNGLVAFNHLPECGDCFPQFAAPTLMRLKFPHRDSSHCPQPEFIQYIFVLLRYRTTCAETPVVPHEARKLSLEFQKEILAQRTFGRPNGPRSATTLTGLKVCVAETATTPRLSEILDWERSIRWKRVLPVSFEWIAVYVLSEARVSVVVSVAAD